MPVRGAPWCRALHPDDADACCPAAGRWTYPGMYGDDAHEVALCTSHAQLYERTGAADLQPGFVLAPMTAEAQQELYARMLARGF